MTHGIKKMVYNPIISPMITAQYFCNYWGLGEDYPVMCNLEGREDSCDNCPYLTVKLLQRTVQQIKQIYKCKQDAYPIADPMEKCRHFSLPTKKYCYKCPSLEIMPVVNTVQVQVIEPDFYVSNPDFLEI